MLASYTAYFQMSNTHLASTNGQVSCTTLEEVFLKVGAAGHEEEAVAERCVHAEGDVGGYDRVWSSDVVGGEYV